MRCRHFVRNFVRMLACCALVACWTAIAAAASDLTFCCAPDNDLYRVMTADGAVYPRCDTPAEAVRTAPNGGGVLILADDYPTKTTDVAPAVFAAAAKKKLRLYVEYPTSLPGMTVDKPQTIDRERGVITAGVFGAELPPMRIVTINDCHFVPVDAADPYMVIAMVAGFDTAVYGLIDAKPSPILFKYPHADVLVATTKLSQFVTARYAPQDAWRSIWKMVLNWLDPRAQAPNLTWTPTVHPAYGPKTPLPKDAGRTAVVKCIDWHSNARLLMHHSWAHVMERYRDSKYSVGPPPDLKLPVSDGEWGLLEAYSSKIRCDGSQYLRWWQRTDCTGESSLAFALRWRLDGDQRSRKIAGNLLDWVYFRSGLFNNDPMKPMKSNYGLLEWGEGAKEIYFADNDVKAILGGMGTAAILESDRWNDVLIKNILGNFRTTGSKGFRGNCLGPNERPWDWRTRWQRPTVNYHPHYEAWIWASYLWLYHKTGFAPLLQRTRGAIETTMQAYPEKWHWTNGFQQERARMLLPLAWLVRVDDTPLHRQWLNRIALDMRSDQHACGALLERLGEDPQLGEFGPPLSNTRAKHPEAPLIMKTGDPVADMLYTCNFAFFGLHEAYAATGDSLYKEMEDKLADFLIRIQIRSKSHPELDGAWFRAFDVNRWEYWAATSDQVFGPWLTEVGWTEGWITTVLAMRELKLNLWDLTKQSTINRHFDRLRKEMLPDEALRRQN